MEYASNGRVGEDAGVVAARAGAGGLGNAAAAVASVDESPVRWSFGVAALVWSSRRHEQVRVHGRTRLSWIGGVWIDGVESDTKRGPFFYTAKAERAVTEAHGSEI